MFSILDTIIVYGLGILLAGVILWAAYVSDKDPFTGKKM